jgi:hypothetical protein
MALRARIQLLALEHCWSISTGSCLTTALIALISLWSLFTFQKSCWDHYTSAIMRSWWNVSKHGWDNRQQNSLTQADKTFSLIWQVSLRGSLSMYVFLVYNIVMYWPIARQQIDKHIPAKMKMRNNRTPIPRKRISKQASTTTERLFLRGPCRGVIKGQKRSFELVKNKVEFWRWQ